jgi:hypothetical protein
VLRKTGHLRDVLLDSIERVRNRQLTPEQATAIAKLAGQISLSMQVEANMRQQVLEDKRLPVGEMVIVASDEVAHSPVSQGRIVHRISDEAPNPVKRASSAFDFAETLK